MIDALKYLLAAVLEPGESQQAEQSRRGVEKQN
jgi:hypothetical protein